jgi:hypothetical protein
MRGVLEMGYLDDKYMLPTKFRFIWLSGLRGEDFFKSNNKKFKLDNNLQKSLKKTTHMGGSVLEGDHNPAPSLIPWCDGESKD